MNASIFDAKTKFSELVKRAQAGERVIVTSGRAKTPVVEIKAIHPVKPQRIGFLEHLALDIPDSFFFDASPEQWSGNGNDPDDPLNWPEERVQAVNSESDRKKRAELKAHGRRKRK